MKKLIFTTALLVGGSASGAMAQSVADQVVSQLQSQGYTYFEVKNGPSQVKIEAVRGAQEVEFVYDLATGTLLKQEQGSSDPSDRGRTGVQTRSESRDFVDSRNGNSRSDDDDDSDEDDDDDSDEDDDE